MISSYNITTQNVTVDGLLTFTTDRILTGCTVTRNGPTFQLNKPGYYYVTFNANGSATSVADVTIELQKMELQYQARQLLLLPQRQETL